MEEKKTTEEKALKRLAALCAKAEHCSGEMIDKMRQWGLDDEGAQARILEYLTKHKFVDDGRFCHAFVEDKIKYNKWGRMKIVQALRMKHVDEDIYQPILDDVPQKEWIEILEPLIKAKMRTVKAANDYEASMKVIRFAAGRGFDMDIIHKAIDELNK